MHPTMSDWLAELDLSINPTTAHEEALRFLEVVARGGHGSPASARNHAEWKARDGFPIVLAHARALAAFAPLTTRRPRYCRF